MTWVYGTSCSTPVFASVISLLNDRLIGAGKPVLGFLNPFLYSTGASALHDITTGSNLGCNTSGFPAEDGWDPVNSFPFYGRWMMYSRHMTAGDGTGHTELGQAVGRCRAVMQGVTRCHHAEF
jgi:subtilase family serine protease